MDTATKQCDQLGMQSIHDRAAELFGEGRYAEAELLLRTQLRARPGDGKALRGLNRLLLLQGTTPEPEDAPSAFALAEELASTLGPARVQGRDEGPRLQRASDLIARFAPDIPVTDRPRAAHVLWRAGRYAEAEALGDVSALARVAAVKGEAQALLGFIARVSGERGRAEVADWHRLWAERLEASAKETPIRRSLDRSRAQPRLRLGFLSSDLRGHVVGYFAQPLFQFRDPRFDLFIYSSWPGPADNVQHWFAERCTFRPLPPDDREAAEIIASDELDALIEIGGPTPHNRPGVLAFRPTPIQASWLGYPASLQMDAIDYCITDRYLVGDRQDLLCEKPLLLPNTWLTLAPAAFPAAPEVSLEPPLNRNGYITFGTANDPYKFSPEVWRVWARIVASVPDARFLIIRPEVGARSFQEYVLREFLRQGVGADRVIFRPLRGAVRPQYAEIDIALDPFPLTGGTTTCDALWMGVPTVTLAGDAIYERLSASILAHAGWGELIATSIDEYERIAAFWAADPRRLATFRSGIRDQVRGLPLGQPEVFASDFYNTVHELVASAPSKAVL